MLVKFKLFSKDGRFQDAIKLPFGDNREIVECPGYSSRSGMHWEKCYYYSDSKIVEYVGIVKRLTTVLKFRPMTYDDYYKPIPREGKNIVMLPIDAYERLHGSLLVMMCRILGDNHLMLKSTENYAEVFIYEPYDMQFIGIEIDSQSNLTLFLLNATMKKIKEIEKTIKTIRTNETRVSQHHLLFDKEVKVINTRRSTRRYDITASLILNMPSKITLWHPEHGEKTIDIPDIPGCHGLLALHISSMHIE